jgi:hypothetical protein
VVNVGRLKKECGNSFTFKLEVMFKDINLSTDLMKAFQVGGWLRVVGIHML